MTKILNIAGALAVAALVTVPPIHAQGRGGGQGRGPSAGPANGAQQGVGRPEVNPRQGPREPQERGNLENREERKSADNHDQHAATGKPTFSDKLERNPQLSEKLRTMLPAGTDLKAASAGFKNEGQFIAALHVSKNLNIPFDQLKTRMTGNNSMSLGQAIHELRPDLEEKKARDEAKRAEREAKDTQKLPKTT
jgi:hypothetical protein